MLESLGEWKPEEAEIARLAGGYATWGPAGLVGRGQEHVEGVLGTDPVVGPDDAAAGCAAVGGGGDRDPRRPGGLRRRPP